MADATPTQIVQLSPSLRDDCSAASCFADSAITDMSTVIGSPSSKNTFSDSSYAAIETCCYTPAEDVLSDRLTRLDSHVASDREPQTLDEEIQTAANHFDHVDDMADTSSNLSRSTSHTPPHPQLDLEPTAEREADLTSHLTTTVSSLRLRQQEQAHLHTLFTSKLEALAQRSLEQEASISSLTAEIKTLRDRNTHCSHENAALSRDNDELRASTHDIHNEVLDRDTAMNAMTGAVRGLEGWIQSARLAPPNSPAGLPSPPLSDPQRHRRRGRGAGDVIRGKGRFRGRYHRRDTSHDTGTHDALINEHSSSNNNTADPSLGRARERETNNTTETIEGVMAWIRGFKDIEDGIKAKRGELRSNEERTWSTTAPTIWQQRQPNGHPPDLHPIDTTDAASTTAATADDSFLDDDHDNNDKDTDEEDDDFGDFAAPAAPAAQH